VVGAVVELGEKLGIPMPHTRTVYACVKLLETNVTAARPTHAVSPTSLPPA